MENKNVKEALEILFPFMKGKRMYLSIVNYFTESNLFYGPVSDYDGRYDSKEVRTLYIDDLGELTLEIGSFRNEKLEGR